MQTRMTIHSAFTLPLPFIVALILTLFSLFFNDKVKDGTASGRYQEQLLGMIKSKREIVMRHCRIEHANAYDLRKGSVTYATSGTTYPSLIPFIARRGEWSMAAVLDVY